MTRNPSDVFREHQVVAFDAIAEPYRLEKGDRDMSNTRNTAGFTYFRREVDKLAELHRKETARKYRPLRIEQIRDLLRLAAQVAVAAEYERSMDREELQTLHDATSEAEHWADIRE